MDRTLGATQSGHRSEEEKIVVTVRLRPLNKREQFLKDQIAWECTDDLTIVFKRSSHERIALPLSFTFDAADRETIALYDDKGSGSSIETCVDEVSFHLCPVLSP